MSALTLWAIAALVIASLEILTGTFHLLMLALGAVAGALAAWMGASETTQVVVAAVVGGLAVAIWHVASARHRAQRNGSLTSNTDLHLDIGQTVEVPAWKDDGTTLVQYRGAQWAARLQGAAIGHPGRSGPHRICALEGNCLVLEHL